METIFRDDSADDSSSGCESDMDELKGTEQHIGNPQLSADDYNKAVHRLPRQNGHHKLKVRHQVVSEAVPLTNIYLGRHWEVCYPSLERATRSETLAAIKQAIEDEVMTQTKQESQTMILATRCLSSVHEELRESVQQIKTSEPLSASCVDVDHQGGAERQSS